MTLANRPFDWKKVCADDVARPFPPIAGRGRGKPLEEAMKEASRRVQEKRLTPHAAGFPFRPRPLLGCRPSMSNEGE